MSGYSKSASVTCDESITNASMIDSRPSSHGDGHVASPLLTSYDRRELLAREEYLKQVDQRRNLEMAALERKAFADSLVDQFELTGSNRPADANPRQLYLF